MEDQLYVRLRGRVLGPYDTAKLQSLAKRGQLSRMHEVSPDSINWVPASKYLKLFVGEDMMQELIPQPVKINTQSANRNQECFSPPGRRWWYNNNGIETGPVDQATLPANAGSGKPLSRRYRL